MPSSKGEGAGTCVDTYAHQTGRGHSTGAGAGGEFERGVGLGMCAK